MIHHSGNLVGTWRRFGAVGPVYEIIGVGDALPCGDHTMRVRVVEGGEELDYRVAELLNDPQADCIAILWFRRGGASQSKPHKRQYVKSRLAKTILLSFRFRR